MLKTDLSGLNIYTAEQCRTLDKIAIEEAGIPGFTLMRKAAKAAFQWLLKQSTYQQLAGKSSPSGGYQQSVTVFAGTGNNGGDGFVLASLAKQYGIETQVYVLGAVEKIQGDAQLAYAEALENGVDIRAFDDELELQQGFVVDAMLGTGLGGNVRGTYTDAIALINQSGLPVLSLDVPSGLCSDTGAVLGSAIKASHTITFIGLKRGLLTGSGPELSGHLVLSELEIPESVYAKVNVSSAILDHHAIRKTLKPRPREAHKGLFGHVLVIGGDYGMAGAVAMAAEAAARVGAGLVSVATRPEHVAPIVSRRPEVMVHGIASGQQLAPLLASASVLVIGPGLGKSPWSEQLLQQAYQADLPTVVDADALNLISEKRIVESPFKDNWVLTPHPGEAARLLGQTNGEIQQDRFQSAQNIQKHYGGVAVLKGAGSLIAGASSESNSEPHSPHLYLCQAGNPGMATGGMGDVLSGVIAGMIAQGLDLALAARTGVTLHAMAADLAAAGSGERGLLATDLMLPLRRLVNSDLG